MVKGGAKVKIPDLLASNKKKGSELVLFKNMEKIDEAERVKVDPMHVHKDAKVISNFFDDIESYLEPKAYDSNDEPDPMIDHLLTGLGKSHAALRSIIDNKDKYLNDKKHELGRMLDNLKTQVMKDKYNYDRDIEASIKDKEIIVELPEKAKKTKKESGAKRQPSKWNIFVKTMRAKPKYNKMNYKDFLKIASVKYKKNKSA